jgi:hypothetical protein
MSLFLAAVLIIVGLLAAVAVAVGIPVVFGIMAYDVVEARKNPQVQQATSAEVRIAAERGVARAFVIAGGVFWAIAAFAGLYSFQETGFSAALLAAFFPLVACLATLIVGWYFERTTAALLMLAALAVVAWGVIYQFEMGVWILMTLALIGPMLTASALFWMARRDQEAFELETAMRPQLAPIFAARSSLG